MHQFYRAVRLTFRYKWSIVAAIICALLIGVLWGGGITAVAYPIVEVCFEKNVGTISRWIDLRLETIREKERDAEGGHPDGIAEANGTTGRESTGRSGWEQYWDPKGWLLYLKPLADRYTPDDPFLTVVLLMAVMLAASTLKSLVTITHSILSAHIAQRGALEIREEFFGKLIGYEVNHFNRQGIADMMSRFTNDMTSLTNGLNLLYGKLVREPIKMVVCLIAAAWISWQLLLLTMLLAPPAAFSIRWLARSIKRVVRRGMEEMAVMYGRFEETFRSIRVVKAFAREGWERTKFRRTNRTYYEKAMKIAKYEALTNPLTELFGMLMISVAILVGAYLMMNNRTQFWGIPMGHEPLTRGALVAFFALLAGAADPARKLSDIFTSFQSAAAAADRIYEIIDRPIPVLEIPRPKRLERHSKSIVLDHVFFAYGPERSILKDVSLEIPFGETVAIVGPSGCGKSTLLSLLPRFADADSGKVLIDGIDIKEIRIKDLRRQLGLVTQEPVLFNDTVFNNIRYGDPAAGENEVIEAARKAFAHDFIEKELAEGYATVIGPAGGQISGGQRQRIALARAVLRNPSIFLLDEATSQVDVGSEQKIHEALSGFVGGRTTVFVTHRLSALALASRIVVMQDGVIEAVGTHEELLERSPYYHRLHRTES